MDASTVRELDLLHEADVLFYISLFFYGMAIWEFVSRLPMEMHGLYIPEVKRFGRGKLWHTSLPVVLVIINRLALPAQVATSLAFQRQPLSCRGAMRAAYSLLGVLTCTCKAIEVLRVTGIRRSTVVLKSILWTAVVCLFALWLTFANTQDVGMHTPPAIAPYASTCGPFSHLGRWHNAVWASDLAFELILLVLILDQACGGFLAFGKFSSSTHDGTSYLRTRLSLLSKASREYYFMALLWFVLSSAVNILQFVWFSTHQLNLIGGLIVPIQVWITSTVGPRLVVDLKMQRDNMPLLPIKANNSQHLPDSNIGHGNNNNNRKKDRQSSFGSSTIHDETSCKSPVPRRGSFSSSSMHWKQHMDSPEQQESGGESIEMIKD